MPCALIELPLVQTTPIAPVLFAEPTLELAQIFQTNAYSQNVDPLGLMVTHVTILMHVLPTINVQMETVLGHQLFVMTTLLVQRTVVIL